jgi:carbonic anhydrase/acetyltransferase-like protein (isoleucine patch superfamily)
MNRSRVLAALGLSAVVGATAFAALAGAATPVQTSFVDRTANLGAGVTIGKGSYVGPFADLMTSSGTTITIGEESNAQDSTLIDARKKSVKIGNKAILAHGASVRNGASVGVQGTCPEGAARCGSFISFNALVDGAIIEKDAMVSALARVGPGVRIPSGRKVIPGKNVTAQSQVEGATGEVTEADREFMNGVLHVNAAFAREYPKLLASDPRAGTGINYDAGGSDFNKKRDLPTLKGKKVQVPGFRNRIIGDVRLEQTVAELGKVMGGKVSLRADEGEPFEIGHIARMGSRTTFHALEDTHVHAGEEGRYGFRSIVHGGPSEFEGAEENMTITGKNVRIGAWAVFFRSRIGDNSTVGMKSVVQQSDLPAGTVVPPKTIMVEGKVAGTVDW